MTVKLRHELKHLINPADTLALRSRLAVTLPRDSHAEADGSYRIRSLYFDNYRDMALQEKIDGLSSREKFRLRFYGDNTDWIRLEKKTKQRGLCGKKSARVTQAEARQIIAGENGWMLADEREVVRELAAKMQGQLLRPKTIVDYRREAFVFGPGNVRITLDSDIRTGLQSIDFFDVNCPLVPASHPELTVLEVKYDEFLPDLVHQVIQLGERQVTAMSKYAASRVI